MNSDKYRIAGTIFYQHSAGCNPRREVLDSIVDALRTDHEAAAEDMYEALTEAIDSLEFYAEIRDDGEPNVAMQTAQRLRAALAKADRKVDAQ